jgi:hypothetical protein
LNTGGEKTPHRPKVGVVLQLQQRVGSATARTSSRKSPRCEFDSEVKIDFVYQAQTLRIAYSVPIIFDSPSLSNR